MFDRILFVLGESLQALRRNRWMTFATITTAAMALFLLGGLSYVYFKLNSYTKELSERVEIRVFLKEGLSSKEIQAIETKAGRLAGVKTAQFIPKDVSWREYKSKFKQSLVEGVDNPLPNMILIKPAQADAVKSIAKVLQTTPGVEPDGVKYRSDAQEFVAATLARIRVIGALVGLVMLLTSGILIYNTIRLTIVARHREIRIQRMVGASRATVIMPMLIEGVLQGALGGIFAALLILAVRQGYASFIGPDLAAGLDKFSLNTWMLNLSLIGSVFGLLCSMWALRDLRRAR
ncbi:MAG: ABC transporter permease [Chthonomonas sp.]|nr:ABC transporter permease [Chthonomonas sp.]